MIEDREYVNATDHKCSRVFYYGKNCAGVGDRGLGDIGDRGGGMGSIVDNSKANTDLAYLTSKLFDSGFVYLCN